MFSNLLAPRTAPAAAVFLCLALILAVGCDDDGTRPDPIDDAWETYSSDLERETAPDATPAEIDALAAGNHAFAVDLYHELRGDEPGNLLFSPLSIRTAFAMAYGGALGETAEQIAAVLHYDLLPAGRRHAAFNALDLALAARNLPATGEEEAVELSTANSLWGQIGFPFLDPWLDLLAVNYGAAAYGLDFENAPEVGREAINGWVAERTRDRILDLLPPGSISPATRAVLANALYLKAPWADAFSPEGTSDGTFHLLGGGEVTVPMMNTSMGCLAAEGPGWQAVELHLRGEELGFLMIVPDAGEFAAFEADLDADALEAILDELGSSRVDVTMPRFTMEAGCRLKTPLSELGMPLPFTTAADFGGISDVRLFISEAYHKTFLAVDEKGVEAAAATAIVIDITSIPSQVVVDRPFLVGIHDRGTGALLFFGRVLDPSS